MAESNKGLKARGLRIAYWTHFLSPGKEGISNEVWALHEKLKGSFVFAISKHYWFSASLKHRYFGIHAACFFIYRLFARLFQGYFSLQHIYASLGAWHFLKVVKKRPIVLSVVTDESSLPASMYQHVDCFIVQSELQKKRILELVGNQKPIEVIYPGVDLKKFKESPPPSPDRVFTLFFASVPIFPREYYGRGLDLIIQLAQRFPAIRFRMAWRPWGASPEKLFRLSGGKLPKNLEVQVGRFANMPELYHQANATIAPFRTGGGKPFPHSVMESLACGRPVLVSTDLPISDIVRKEGAGEVFAPNLSEASEAIQRLQKNYALLTPRARKCAEKYFSQEEFVKKHLEIYAGLMGVKVDRWKR